MRGGTEFNSEEDYNCKKCGLNLFACGCEKDKEDEGDDDD